SGALHCGAMCVPDVGKCTTNGDCCTGLLCVVPPGSLQGTCTQPVVQQPDMGAVDLAGVDLAGVDLAGADLSAPDLAAPTCAQYGQTCSATVSCCNAVSCLTPLTSGAQPCGPTDTTCTCYMIIQ